MGHDTAQLLAANRKAAGRATIVKTLLIIVVIGGTIGIAAWRFPKVQAEPITAESFTKSPPSDEVSIIASKTTNPPPKRPKVTLAEPVQVNSRIGRKMLTGEADAHDSLNQLYAINTEYDGRMVDIELQLPRAEDPHADSYEQSADTLVSRKVESSRTSNSGGTPKLDYFLRKQDQIAEDARADFVLAARIWDEVFSDFREFRADANKRVKGEHQRMLDRLTEARDVGRRVYELYPKHPLSNELRREIAELLGIIRKTSAR